MLIGMDIDGVLADLMNPLMDFYYKKYNSAMVLADVFSHNLSEVYGITRAESDKRLFQFYKSSHFNSIKPVKGAVPATSKLGKKHTIVAITARPEMLEKKTRGWIENFFGDTISNVYFAYNHHHAHAAEETRIKRKSEFCQKLGVDILVEDALENALECAQVRTKVYLLDYPWNRKPIPQEISRVYSWKEIVDHINIQ